ncbi:ABC transporter permease [Galactobacter valiniphilus]|uniref:ABC transporter permease n=1 Tax=Galactobacter valiniphilus TaxID=2676122 RepID=UPI00373700B8
MSETIKGRQGWRAFVRSDGFVSVLAVVLSLIVGGILIAFTNKDAQASAAYFFAQPGDFFRDAWNAASGAYAAMFRSAIFNYEGTTATEMFNPLSETLTQATPLITASLGVAIAFRAGLFNIGAQGQVIIGAAVAGFVGFRLHLPAPLHILLVVLAAALGGAVWGGLAGWLKAKTGAHEVITTIMLNYVATYLLAFVLLTPLMQRTGSSDPVSEVIDPTAVFPQLIPGTTLRVHLGFVIAILATVFTWWLLSRSKLGYRLRAVGANPEAARTAGISVAACTVIAMALSGAMAGLAGASQVSGTEMFVAEGIAATIGFDAITVALLARSKPLWVFLAALLFGAFRAGGVGMQTDTGTPVDIVLVVQSLIVLFIAAPALTRTIFGIRDRKKAAKAPKAPKSAPPAPPAETPAVQAATVEGGAA